MTTILVKGIPEDLVPFIMKTQWDLKISKKSQQLQIGKAIIHIISEYKKMIESK